MVSKAPRKIRSRLIMTTEQLAAVGSVALESTECEMVVEDLIWKLARLNQESGKLFTQGMQMQNRLEMLLQLGKLNIVQPATLERFTGLISKLKELNGSRNIIIHGSWGAWYTLAEIRTDPLKVSIPIARKRRPNSPPATLAADKVDAVAIEINEFTQKLYEFSKKEWPRLASF